MQQEIHNPSLRRLEILLQCKGKKIVHIYIERFDALIFLNTW